MAETDRSIRLVNVEPLVNSPRSKRTTRASNEHEHTEASVARKIGTKYANQIAYEHTRNRWLIYCNGIWSQDETGHVLQLLLSECEALGDKRLERHARLRGIEEIAKSLPELAITAARLDFDAYMLGTPDGPIDLRMGKRVEADPLHYITHSAACAPSDIATPIWSQFLADCTAGDASFVRFLQQYAGLCLTGDTSAQCLVFIYGRGRNGKGVFVRAISGVLGTYAHRAAVETFTAGADRHPTEIASMQGKRLVYCSETERGRTWAEGRLKDVTGNDKLRARFMRADDFEYQPAFKLIISGNYEPAIENCDEAMRGRFHVVPFDQVFSGQNADRHLDDKLKAEWPGILQWCIAGALDWQANGLVVPDKVRLATAAYFDRQDSFNHWLETECCRSPDLEDTTARVFKSWATFAKENGENPGSQKSLAERLQRAGFTPSVTRRDGKGVRLWRGLKVLMQ